MPVCGSGGVVCSWSLLFTAIIAVVRQKLHLSPCSNLRSQLIRSWPESTKVNLETSAQHPRSLQDWSSAKRTTHEIKRDHPPERVMKRGQYPTAGTGRIRPLADSKQATVAF